MIHTCIVLFFFQILIFFNSFCEVTSQCAVVNYVPICKQSVSAWLEKASELCSNIDTYHCLITENYKENVDHEKKYVECCMPSETISAGNYSKKLSFPLMILNMACYLFLA